MLPCLVSSGQTTRNPQISRNRSLLHALTTTGRAAELFHTCGKCRRAGEGAKHVGLVQSDSAFDRNVANGTSDVLPDPDAVCLAEASEEQPLLEKTSFASENALHRLISTQLSSSSSHTL